MDDEILIRKLMAKMLARLGFEVECAAEGAEAIRSYERAKASGRGFAAVILDLTIPGGMGGKDAANRLKKIDAGVKIILSSGYSDDSTIAEFRRHGFDGVLLKPWTPAQLGDALRRVLS